MKQFSHLVQFFLVGLFKEAAGHCSSIRADHAVEQLNQRCVCKFKVTRMQQTYNSVRRVSNPLTAILEDTRVHGSVVCDHTGKPITNLVIKFTHGFVFRRDVRNQTPRCRCFPDGLVAVTKREWRDVIEQNVDPEPRIYRDGFAYGNK